MAVYRHGQGRTLSRTLVCRRPFALAALPGRAHDDLVEADVAGTGHGMEDRLRNVLGREHLADLLSRTIQPGPHDGVQVVPLELRVDVPGGDDGHAHVRVE